MLITLLVSHPTTLLLLVFSIPLVFSDPQTNLLDKRCGWYPAADAAVFSANLNATLADLRANLAAARFATAQRLAAPNPVFALAQCRDYLSAADCLACYDAAAAEVGGCGRVTDGFVVLDGCFLRYNNNNFFDEVTLPGDVSLSAGYCGEGRPASPSDEAPFNSTVAGVLSYLVREAPARFYKAVAARSGEGAAVYGVGQCLLTVSSDGCKECLELAHVNIGRCPPALEARAVDLGCFLRYSDRDFFNSSGVVELDRLLHRGADGSKDRRLVLGLAGGGGGAAVVAAAMGLVWWEWRRRRKRRGTVIVGPTEQDSAASFAYHNLRRATMNFSDRNKLGEGGFATVYKGVLNNGMVAAVKRLAISETEQARINFESEVTLISRVHHKNLLRLLGCCRKGPELLLVYEYMENGSLHSYLFGGKRGSLNWEQMFDIVLGTARGLAYLHGYSTGIIHRDVKPANILLDKELQPKLADFGLVRLLPDGISHMSTRLAGTIGYAAPEYVVNGQLSDKADVYSFGIVVLEVVSGQRSNDLSIESVSGTYLLDWAWRLYEAESVLELVDKHLELSGVAEAVLEVMRRTIEVGLMCTQTAQRRPSMSQVVDMLLDKEGVHKKTTKLGLVRPTFLTKDDIKCLISASGETSSSGQMSSIATMSTFRFSAR